MPGKRVADCGLRVLTRTRTESVVEFYPSGRRRYATWIRRSYSEPCTSCGEEITWHEWKLRKGGPPRSARRFLTCTRCSLTHFRRLRARGAQANGAAGR